jgi:hypothetical protein
MAVQVAKRLGAGRVVGAGRDLARLSALASAGADEVVRLTDDAEATPSALSAAAADVDIVIDYLWGKPAQWAIVALITGRSDPSRAMDWVQIGSMAGPTMSSCHRRQRLLCVPSPLVDPAGDICSPVVGLSREDKGGDVQMGDRPVAPSARCEAFSVEITGLAHVAAVVTGPERAVPTVGDTPEFEVAVLTKV